MFEILIIIAAIFLIVLLFKLFRKTAKSSFIKIVFMIILRLIIIVAVPFIGGVICSIVDASDDILLLVLFGSFAITVAIVIAQPIMKRKSLKRKEQDELNEMTGFKQALLHTRQLM